MRSKKLQLRRDRLAQLTDTQLDVIAGAAGPRTLESGCDSGIQACDPLTWGCFTHTTSLDCSPTEICPTNGCS